MIKYFFTLLAFCLTVHAHSQTTYQADLDAVYSLLKKTPSYKDQIKGNKQSAFDSLYQALRTDTANASNGFDHFYKLAQLFFPLRDNHLGFYQYPWSVLKPSDFKNTEAIKQYRESAFFKYYPTATINPDSLESVLTTKAKDSVEGIYYYDNYLTIGLYRTANRHELVGIVLNSTLPNWEKGQVAISLYEYQPNYFRAIYGHPVDKNLILYNNEKFRNQSLINSQFYASLSTTVYKKTRNEPDHVNMPANTPAFQFTHLNPAIQYIRLGNFSAMNNAMKVSQAFYDKIKDSLTAPNLIVDLRDNTGGAEKVSNKFFQLIKQYANKGNVYLLINNGTMSQGEIFTLQLKKYTNVKSYGQTTKGTITYGVNYGGMENLPSGRYGVVMTDMRDNSSYLAYENYGVMPDIVLNNSSDWVNQLIEVIEKK